MKINPRFYVRNEAKTREKRSAQIVTLTKLLREKHLDYNDLVDSDTWETVDTVVSDQLYLRDRMCLNTSESLVCTMINQATRTALIGTLGFYQLPISYDTALFMIYYRKICEGMTDILNTIQNRRAQ